MSHGMRSIKYEELEQQVSVWRDCFEEITAKATPFGNDDPIKAYLIPAGPIHRAAGKTGCQAFGMGERIAELEAQLAEANGALREVERAIENVARLRSRLAACRDQRGAADQRIAELERQLADMRKTLENVAHAVKIAHMNSRGIRLAPERRHTMTLLQGAEERLSAALARAPANGTDGG